MHIYQIYFKGIHRWTLTLNETDVAYIERSFSYVDAKKVEA